MNTAAINGTVEEQHRLRTKQGIARVREEGVAWGSHGYALAARNKSDAHKFAESLRSIVCELMVSGKRGPTALTGALNANRIATPKGGRWHPSSVHKLLKMLGPSLVSEVKAQGAARAAELKSKWEGHNG